jgi:hypothetical protein
MSRSYRESVQVSASHPFCWIRSVPWLEPLLYEADAYAVTILRRSGLDGKAMTNTLAWLQHTAGASKGGFLATHPGTDDRIQKVQEMAMEFLRVPSVPYALLVYQHPAFSARWFSISLRSRWMRYPSSAQSATADAVDWGPSGRGTLPQDLSFKPPGHGCFYADGLCVARHAHPKEHHQIFGDASR